MKKIVLTVALLITASCASSKKVEAPAPAPLPQSVAEAVANPLRAEKNRERDVYRHPQQTLEFFEVRPDQTVVEIYPGRGWYAEILAPMLVTQGKYVAAMGNGDINFPQNADLRAWTQAHPEVGARMNFVELSAPDHLKLGEDNSADRVLTFRNVHNWMKAKNEAKFFKAFYNVLKPGGILGVVEHRAAAGKKNNPIKSGYVSEKAVIAMAKAAGFKLVEKSEINANPKDTKNHPEGVWTLPPTLKLGDKDREKYMAIGESDRMTLKFVKPGK